MPHNRQHSAKLFERAAHLIPGGVNSPVRAFKNVGGHPLFIERGDGAYIYDADGNKYLDFVGSWGPLILGHNSETVREAILSALERGTSFGAPTEIEIEFAETFMRLVPAVEMLRLVNSGTEATMSALRLARAYTGRDKILKFNGCYHGHSDSLLVKAGSGVATLGIAGSSGVPADVVRGTASIEFNDLDLFSRSVNELGPESIAAVIVEPVPGNMGLILPEPGFLAGLKKICAAHGILLIFDEVMSGFRVARGGAQQLYRVEPDLSTWGKVIGGGLPVGAFGGRRDIMEMLAPLGPVYQAGTLSGNPLAMSAGLAVLRFLEKNDPFPALTALSARFADGIDRAGAETGIDVRASSCGSMIGLFFTDTVVKDYAAAAKSDVPRFRKFFWQMLDRGFYFAPSAFEAGFLSTAHTEGQIDETVSAARDVFKQLASGDGR